MGLRSKAKFIIKETSGDIPWVIYIAKNADKTRPDYVLEQNSFWYKFTTFEETSHGLGMPGYSNEIYFKI